MTDFENEVPRCLEVLKKGGVILYPTDTIWGIGCDATNSEAIEKIFQIKQRSEAKNLISLLDDAGKLIKYVREIPAVAYDMIEFTNKPLTIIFDNALNISPKLIANDGSIAIRITKDPFCKELVRRLNKPLVSTSANISGQPSPASFGEVNQDIKSKVDYIVSLRQNEKSNLPPSSIIKLGANGQVQIVRK